jgi:3-oxoacyl-[acyl-carrier-protein] synthase-3
MMKAFVAGIRSALPEGVLTNDELAALYEGWTAEKILAKTGIRSRHVAAPDEFASDLAYRAADGLLNELGIDRSTVDYLLFCTQTPDYIMPTTACLLQHRLGLPTTCAAMDYVLGCSGYIYGLGLAKALVQSGQARTLLLLTGDTYSKIVNRADKSVRTLFGDGATATLIVAREDEESLVGPFVYGTDGGRFDELNVEAGGMRRRYEPNAPALPDESGNARTCNDLYMNGAAVFTFTLRVVPDSVARLLQGANATLDDIDLFVFHQANRMMLEHLRKKLGIPAEKFPITMEDLGNTVSSTLPLALEREHRAGRLQPGALVMLAAFGVGYSWGATLLRWGAPTPAATGAAAPA